MQPAAADPAAGPAPPLPPPLAPLTLTPLSPTHAQAFDLYEGREWIWGAVGYLLGSYLLLTAAAIWLLERVQPPRIEPQVGAAAGGSWGVARRRPHTPAAQKEVASQRPCRRADCATQPSE
jgi:hypothetical protein